MKPSEMLEGKILEGGYEVRKRMPENPDHTYCVELIATTYTSVNTSGRTIFSPVHRACYRIRGCSQGSLR